MTEIIVCPFIIRIGGTAACLARYWRHAGLSTGWHKQRSYFLSNGYGAERRRQVISISALYFGDPVFKYRLGIDYPDFSWFSLVLPGRCWDSTLPWATVFSFHILSNLSFVEYPAIWRTVYTGNKWKVFKQKNKSNKVCATLPRTF